MPQFECCVWSQHLNTNSFKPTQNRELEICNTGQDKANWKEEKSPDLLPKQRVQPSYFNNNFFRGKHTELGIKTLVFYPCHPWSKPVPEPTANTWSWVHPFVLFDPGREAESSVSTCSLFWLHSSKHFIILRLFLSQSWHHSSNISKN